MNNHGNALFIILIAVALFAALSYAITQSGRGSGNTDRENARLLASQIMQELAKVDAAITRMRTTNGCMTAQIDMDPKPNNDYQRNPNSPSVTGDFSCALYHASGGGVSSDPSVPAAYSDSSIGTWASDTHVRIGTIGGSGNELVVISHPITDAVCNEINRMINASPAIPAISGNFDNFVYDGTLGTTGDNLSTLTERTYCISRIWGGETAPSNIIYHVVMES